MCIRIYARRESQYEPGNHTELLKVLSKAEDAIKTAEYDLTGSFTLAAVNRTYYACYYCMVALLLTKDVYAKTHQGTRAKFSELFIKTHIFPEDIATYIKIAFDLRQEADYDFDADITPEEAQDVINIWEFPQARILFIGYHKM